MTDQREKSPGEIRYAMSLVTKGKKKKFVKTKLLPPDEQSRHMKILRANFFLCVAANCVNQHFEILNLVDYGWKVSEGKLEPNWFEGSALVSVQDIDQEKNNLDTLPDVSENTDTTSNDLEDVNEGICLSHSNDEEELYWALCE